jgi:hypothetical protein
MSEIVNYSNIYADVKKKHEEFSKDAEGFVQKVTADSQYLVEINSARLTKMFSIFKELKVIDKIEKEYVGKFQLFKISKDGFGNWVEIFVSEEKIIFNTSNFETVANARSPFIMPFVIDDTDKFWHELSIELLDQIHSTIYERKRVAEEKITSALGG